MTRDLIKFALIIILVVIPIRVFVAQPFIVNGASMDPTFSNGEYLIVDQISYRLNQPERGAVIVFKYPKDHRQFFIKRVVGLPGETLEIKNSSITIYNQEFPEGKTLEEPNLDRTPPTEELKITLKESEYFVLGDNRRASSDSRAWGPLEENLIIGRPLFRLLPPSSFSLFPGIN